MISENEKLWKTHRKDMDKVLQQLEYKGDIKNTPHKDTLANAHEFLTDLMMSSYVNAPNVRFVGERVELEWRKAHQVCLTVTFESNNKWNVFMEKSITSQDGPEPSFWIEKTPHFCLDDHFVKEIEKPQPWSEPYEPRIRPKRIMWCSGYWDGPLSGYCTDSVGNDIYYFDCEEELTYSPRDRMFAVYELSKWEQIRAFALRTKWMFVLNYRWLWFFYMTKSHLLEAIKSPFKSKDTDTIVKQYQEKREKWKSKHKLIGYFTY